jgi:hypothetical protein
MREDVRVEYMGKIFFSKRKSGSINSAQRHNFSPLRAAPRLRIKTAADGESREIVARQFSFCHLDAGA